MLFRIADRDKKENYYGDCKLHQRVTKSSSTGHLVKTVSNSVSMKPNEILNTRDKDRPRSFSDSSSNSASSRKNSTTLPAPLAIPEEKPKPTKEPADTPPRSRTKRKSHEANRYSAKYEVYEEPREQ